jgi:hypothetical protein
MQRQLYVRVDQDVAEIVARIELLDQKLASLLPLGFGTSVHKAIVQELEGLLAQLERINRVTRNRAGIQG